MTQSIDPFGSKLSMFHCLVIIVSSDEEPPVILNMPSDIIQATDIGKATAAVSWTEPTAIDNSGVQTLTSSDKPGNDFNIGATIVTYMSVDRESNRATSAFTVIVEGIFIQTWFNLNGYIQSL